MDGVILINHRSPKGARDEKREGEAAAQVRSLCCVFLALACIFQMNTQLIMMMIRVWDAPEPTKLEMRAHYKGAMQSLL